MEIWSSMYAQETRVRIERAYTEPMSNLVEIGGQGFPRGLCYLHTTYKLWITQKTILFWLLYFHVGQHQILYCYSAAITLIRRVSMNIESMILFCPLSVEELARLCHNNINSNAICSSQNIVYTKYITFLSHHTSLD